MRGLAELNPAQRQAVEAGEGPLLIVAGPGTGKTKTLTTRIAHLVSSGVAPGTITALTFTNKAAQEMRLRVASLLDSKAPLPRIATFHAVGYELLSRQADAPLQFIDDMARQQLISDLPKAVELKGLSARELGLRISRLKNSAEPKPDKQLAQLTGRYNAALVEKGLHDFDDLLTRTHTLLVSDTVLHDQLAATCQYLFVDEFQDTNDLQYELMQAMRGSDNVCVIGDPLQSIYGFRGAQGDVFERFRADFPASQAINLTTNYRSRPEVVALGNRVFPDNPPLRPHRKEPGVVQAVQVLNEYSEATWILAEIEQQLGGTDMLRGHRVDTDRQQSRQFSDFAVLYRTHRTAKVLRQTLAESGIPYQVVGDESPYAHPPIKTILQALRFLAGGEGPEFKALLAGIDSTKPLTHIVQRIIDKLGLAQADDAQALNQFMSTLVRFDDKPITDYLGYIDEIADQGFYDQQAHAVTLLTIHAAKGLEFTHVFLLAAEEGLLPCERKGLPTDIDEERRLFYVAVTRAQEQLDILYAKSRGGQPVRLSRFVTGIPVSVLPRVTDPAMADQQRRLQKRRQKRAQQTLL